MTPYLAVVAIVRNEALYLPEWLEFHRLVGIEHFYIYDNGSDDGTAQLLLGYDVVTLINWPGKAVQLAAYKHALTHCEGRWLAFIDVDEFLYSPTYLPVPSLLRFYEDVPAVGVCWATFGTSFRASPKARTIGTYCLRAANDVNRHVKSIVQPDRVRSTHVPDPHHFDCEGRDELGRPLEGPFARTPTWEWLKINHYTARSEEEARAKLTRPRADNGELRGQDLLAAELNAVYDDTINPYLPLLVARELAKA